MDSLLFNPTPINTKIPDIKQTNFPGKTTSDQSINIPQKPEAGDKLTISSEAREMLNKDGVPEKSDTQNKDNSSRVTDQGKTAGHEKTNSKKTSLDDRDQLVVQRLKMADIHVKMHEQQHISAGGGYVRGGPTFQYTTGPDGKQYAVAGEVRLDTSPIKDNPKATIQKAQTIRQAALAPADPSGADRSVAAAASAMEVKAQSEIAKQGENGESTNTTQSSNSKNTSPKSPYHKQLAAYQNSKNFAVGGTINQVM